MAISLRKPHTWLLASSLSLTSPCWALDLEGIRLANATQVSGQQLVLNGAGISKRWFFNIYAMGLYLPDRRDSSSGIMNMDGPRRMQITLMRNVSSSEFDEAIASTLTRYAEKTGRQQISANMNQVVKALARQPNGLRKGDVLTLDWLPGSGTRIELNGRPLLEPLSGTEFYTALLRIWLGDDPTDPTLKPKLLGKGRTPPADDGASRKVLVAQNQNEW